MLILNTGGTFNKRYDPIKGELIVPQDNHAVESILKTMNVPVACEGMLYKDSLQMDDQDRSKLARGIQDSFEKCIIIVHGTDTMDLSAKAVAALDLKKVIIFTGAMVPYSIDPTEATANLAMAIGFAQGNLEDGVYVCMQGVLGPYDKVRKNRLAGKFEYVQR